MYNILLGVYLLVAIGLVGLVLIQQGKGADMGASFGSGASNTVFGSSGSGNFLTRSTAVLATLFFIISLALGNLSASHSSSSSKWENLGKEPAVTKQVTQKAPAKQKDAAKVAKDKKTSSSPVDQVPE
ncbi:preprotein translocase subunit SecG [Celerinatantimonas diazotrophica]|uniref:Protein-export membrane protein SecG n=1 Tax=Celerinatantimonas diazotrophica TaxID=412034 RepID=A0A4R1K423_9GAMM|nr:preprotein translocase subunit SecG [Celerinatantimonas diazotrophica]TCK58865.1 protein translocase subunit secG [Celerinatantimonas diazotrophica]CAG9297497.1 Protein-export membrane protein SecG [Celerinatantimonas diazotrophica]